MGAVDVNVNTGLQARWPMAQLFEPPEWQAADDAEAGIRPITFEGLPYRGRPSRVFAYLGVPQSSPPAAPGELDGHGVPGMVLVHGGGGTAFREWVAIWNARGYAAIAMDLAGCGAGRQRRPDGGPAQDDSTKFADPVDAWHDHWTFHSVANVIRAHSLLRSLPGVDASRIGLTGISWGGYLTCIVAGLDSRFGCAIPVYGCGFLQDNSAWVDRGHFDGMTEAQRRHWHDWCDPAVYVGGATMPMLFVNGTNDFAYPLDSHRRTFALVGSPKTLAVRVAMAHGHPQGWAPPEIARFAECHFRDEPPLPVLGLPARHGANVRAPLGGAGSDTAVQLAYTSDGGRWQDRMWRLASAIADGASIVATLPATATAYFFTLSDSRGGYCSTPYEEVTVG
jgi:dienelactone hydrolase